MLIFNVKIHFVVALYCVGVKTVVLVWGGGRYSRRAWTYIRSISLAFGIQMCLIYHVLS